MRREVQEPTVGEHGREEHPAFVNVGVSRVTSTPGAVLFDSDVRHQHYMVLEVHTADRQRMLKSDYIHPANLLMRVAMSQAQWAQLVSSPNSGGTPATLEWTSEQGPVPGLPFDSRLDLTAREAGDAAREVFVKVQEALDAYVERKTVGNLRNLQSAVANAASNVQYAARRVTEHTEEVVAKARADIEAMVQAAAERHGAYEHKTLEWPAAGSGAVALAAHGGTNELDPLLHADDEGLDEQ